MIIRDVSACHRDVIARLIRVYLNKNNNNNNTGAVTGGLLALLLICFLLVFNVTIHNCGDVRSLTYNDDDFVVVFYPTVSNCRDHNCCNNPPSHRQPELDNGLWLRTSLLFEPRHEETGCLPMQKQRRRSASHQRFCFRSTDSTIYLLLKSEISSFCPCSVAAQVGLCRTWSETRRPVF